MKTLDALLHKNRAWATANKKQDPGFFTRLCHGQSPECLWIGCCDSRVPAEILTSSTLGELLVHRNVANMVIPDDTNCLSVIQFAVENLGIEHIIVSGHYRCGGVEAALNGKVHAHLSQWLDHLKVIYQKHENRFDHLTSEQEKINLLCELNVAHQTVNVANTLTVRNAWKNQIPVSVHGCIYSIGDGLLEEVGISISRPEDIPTQLSGFKSEKKP